MWLNTGINPSTNETIVPDYADLTTARAIIYGNTSELGVDTSITGYGLGWIRGSYLGHDVRSFHHVSRFKIY